MANLPETEDFAAGTYQIETSDRVLGGPGGIANKQAEQLGNRTAWLKAALTKVLDGVTAVGKATRLATVRTLRFKGAVSGSGTYDGSADTEVTLTLADSGITAGTFSKVEFNVKGIAVSGSNPDTLAGAGITNAYTIQETDSRLDARVAGDWISDAGLEANNPEAPYFRQKSSGAILHLARRSHRHQFSDLDGLPTTAAGHGINNVYTRPETDTLLNQRAAADRILAAGVVAGNPNWPYFRFMNLDGSAGEIINLALASHAHSFASLTDKPTTLGGYGIQGVYTAAQVDGLLRSVLGGDSISAIGLQNGNAALPYMRASANGAVIPLALESHTHTFASIPGKPDSFQGYGIAGGTLTSSVVISTQGQGPGTPGLAVLNDNAGGVVNITLASTQTGVQILHTNGGSGISVVAANGNAPAPVAASVFLANGSACHTEANFMKPVAGQFVLLSGSAILPAGGTWAFSVTGYNGGGAALGGNAGVAAGGTAVGINGNSVGFAWRIQ